MNVLRLHTPLTLFRAYNGTDLSLPFVSGGIKAGFPSPAQDFMHDSLDLNKHVIQHPQETFFAKVDGDSMKNVGICNGDIAVVDRSLPVEHDKIYVCVLDNEFTIKRLSIDKSTQTVWLVPENEKFEPICVPKENENLIIWGRVISVIKKF